MSRPVEELFSSQNTWPVGPSVTAAGWLAAIAIAAVGAGSNVGVSAGVVALTATSVVALTSGVGPRSVSLPQPRIAPDNSRATAISAMHRTPVEFIQRTLKPDGKIIAQIVPFVRQSLVRRLPYYSQNTSGPSVSRVGHGWSPRQFSPQSGGPFGVETQSLSDRIVNLPAHRVLVHLGKG